MEARANSKREADEIIVDGNAVWSSNFFFWSLLILFQMTSHKLPRAYVALASVLASPPPELHVG